MKKVLGVVALSLALFSCSKKNCYECTTSWSDRVYDKQNAIVYQKSVKSEEFCGSEEEMMSYESENTFNWTDTDGNNTVQGMKCNLKH